jgi:hypothetical protein
MQVAADWLRVLERAAGVKGAHTGVAVKKPSPQEVVTALLEAEKAAKHERCVYPFAALDGTWQLCFATATRKVKQRGGIALGQGFYLPRFTPAQISFTVPDASTAEPHTGAISNQIQLGAMRLRFTGPCRYTGKKNLLAFDFTQIQLSLLGKSVYQTQIGSGKPDAVPFAERAIAKLPFFAFFWVADTAIAARGRGGGLALWVRTQPSSAD